MPYLLNWLTTNSAPSLGTDGTKNSVNLIGAFRVLPNLLLILVPVAIVGFTVLYYAVNFPYWDDYIVQEHLVGIKSEGSIRRKILRFFDQHWEHRILWTRLVFYLFDKLNGTLNYYTLTLTGVSGLLWLLGLFYAAFRRLGLSLAYFIPVPFWLFTLQSHENLLWAMASIQNLYVLVFAFGSFYFLASGTHRNRIVAILLAILATFTSGNGSLVLIAGLVVLIWQRRWRSTFLWTLTTGVCLGLYFFDYHRTTFFPSPFRYPYSDWVKSFFVFLGAFADLYPYSGGAAIGYTNFYEFVISLGAVLLAISIFFLIKMLSSKQKGKNDLFWNSFFTAAVLFLITTALITVYSRVGFAGPSYMLQSRYKIYSPVMLCVVYLYALHRWQKYNSYRWAIRLVTIITIFLSLVSSYLCLEGIINQHRKTVSAYFNWQQETPYERRKAIDAVYVPTQLPFYGTGSQLTHPTNSTTGVIARLDSIVEERLLLSIIQEGKQNPTPFRPDNGSYILLTNPDLTYLFPARPLRPSPVALSGFSTYFTADQFHAQILKENVKEGRYQVGILTHQLGADQISMTNQYVSIKSPYDAK